jgi:hypothetical protein
MSNNVAAIPKFRTPRFFAQASAKALALATMLLSSSFVSAQSSSTVQFNNGTGCDFCLTISYCADGCVPVCGDGDVVTDIPVPAYELTEFELPPGMYLRGIKLGDKLCQNTLDSWACGDGWATAAFKNMDCCSDRRATAVIVDGDGYENKLYCQE